MSQGDHCMESLTLNILLIEGLPLLGFIYYLEYKRRMYLLEKNGAEVDTASSPNEKSMVKGLFLLLAGSALIITPGIAGWLGLGTELSFEMLLIGVVIICAGLAIMMSCGVAKILGLSEKDDSIGMR
jgi:hypothetical protein